MSVDPFAPTRYPEQSDPAADTRTHPSNQLQLPKLEAFLSARARTWQGTLIELILGRPPSPIPLPVMEPALARLRGARRRGGRRAS